MSQLFNQRPLKQIFIEKGWVSLEQAHGASEQAGAEDKLGGVLLEQGLITPEQWAEALAEQCNLSYIDLRNFVVPAELFAVIPAERAYQMGLIPLAMNSGILEVAIAEPGGLLLGENLERSTGLRVKFRMGSAPAIAAALKRSEATQQMLRTASHDFSLIEQAIKDNGGSVTGEYGEAEDDRPVVKLINTILSASIQKRASDIHIETYEKATIIKYRIDGVLYPATQVLDNRHHAALISRLKVMAELDIAEKRTPQDGRFRLKFGRREIDFRVSILPAVFGEDVVIRILDKASLVEGEQALRLDNFGIDPDVIKKLRKGINEPYGMVLITGPTGSGKTTTLYGALSELNNGEEKIITVEDPVEYQLDGIVQIAVNEKKGLTFAGGLRSILRHDPDKVMVGEIRDNDTAQIAVQAALTGHLVFATVHANNSVDVIARFHHMGVELYNFISALNCVMAQRLVRIICPNCKEAKHYDAATLELSGLDPKIYGQQQWYEGAGCDQCNGTGYRGRSAITEFLAITPAIRRLVVQRRSAIEITTLAVEEGMITLRQSALAKVLSGETTLKEINRVTFVE
jgi:type IV pilus assembly protein PilB